jgi:hypothetical protein
MNTKHTINSTDSKHSINSMHTMHTKHLSISKLYILEKSGNPIQLTGT